MSDCTRLPFEPSITTARDFHRVDRLLLQRESADNNLQSQNLLMPSAVVATCAMSCGSDLQSTICITITKPFRPCVTEPGPLIHDRPGDVLKPMICWL